MKKSTRITALILSMLTMLSLFVSCSRGDSKASKDGASSATGEPYTVKLVFMAPSVPKDLNEVTKKINDITLKKVNAKFEMLCIPYSNYAQQVNLMLTSDEKMDLQVLSSVLQIGSEVTKGQLRPLDEAIQKYGSGISDALGSTFIKGGVINGKTYSLPSLRDMAAGYGLCMRKDLVTKYNIDVGSIKTLDDVTKMFEKVKAGEPNLSMVMPQTGGMAMLDSLITIDPLSDGFGVLMNQGRNDLKVVDFYESKDYQNYCKLFHQWYQKGYILPSIVTSTDASSDLVKAGKVFSFFAPLKPGYDVQSSLSTGMEMEQAYIVQPFVTTYQVNTISMGIPINCKNVEATMKVLNLLYTDPEVINLLDWGIEGKHYQKVAGETNVIDYPSGVNASNTGYGNALGWEFGNQLLSYVWKGDSSTLYQDLRKFNNTAKVSKGFGFNFDQSPVKTEIAAITNVTKQYRAALEGGVSNPDTELPKFIAALKAAGIDKVVTEKQTQLDKWAASAK